MRKALLNFGILLFVVSGAFQGAAQENDMSDRSVRFGLLASPNLGWIQPRIGEFAKNGLESRLGFGYGVMMDIKVGETANYLFSSGATLIRFGGTLSEAWQEEIDFPGADSSQSYYGKNSRTFRYQYLTIPVLLKMRTNEIGYMTYFGSVGFDLGFRTRAFADYDYTWPAEGPADENDINIASQTLAFRTALNITLGGEFNLSGNTNAYVGIGWHNGLLNVFSGNSKVLIPDGDGNPELDGDGLPITGPNRSAAANYISIDLGVFF